MPEPNLRTANETLNEEFLLMRAKLLEVAASLDRVGRGSGEASDDARVAQLYEAVSVLHAGLSNETAAGAGAACGLAAQLQLIFSLPYKDNWQSEFGLG